MRKMNFEQGSQPWRDWRANKWMASEAASILGLQPSWHRTKSWADLWVAKSGLDDDPSAMAASMMAAGHKHEAETRDVMNKLRLVPFEPACGETEHETWRFAASFDGYVARGSHGVAEWLEVKCPSSRASWHKGIEKWEDIPEHYRIQMLAQFATMDEKEAICHFVIGGPHGDQWLDKFFQRSECEEEIQHLAHEWQRFWKGEAQCVIPKGWAKAASRYRQAALKEMAAKQAASDAKRKLLELANFNEVVADGVSVKQQTRKGSISQKLMIDAGLDPDDFRNYATKSWVVRMTSGDPDG